MNNYYLACGNPNMVSEIKAKLQNKGFNMANFASKFLSQRKYVMKCVILAGGLDAPVRRNIPKPSFHWLKSEDGSILWHIMKIYAQHGINDSLFVVAIRAIRLKNILPIIFARIQI